MMGLGAILFSRQNRRCRKSAPNSNILGANGDNKLRFRAEHLADLFRAGSASSAASWRLCVSLMTARSVCVPAGANHCRERTPRQIAILATCYRAALWLHHGAGGRPFVPDICGLWRRTMTCGRPLAPTGAGGRPFVPVSAHYDDAWPPSGSIMGAGGRPFVPEYAPMPTTMARNMPTVLASTKQHIEANNIKMINHMLPKELRSVATQLDPIQEAPEHSTCSCKCWSGLRRLFSLRWYRPRELSCILDEFFTPH